MTDTAGAIAEDSHTKTHQLANIRTHTCKHARTHTHANTRARTHTHMDSIAQDAYENTALNDAVRHKHDDVAACIRNYFNGKGGGGGAVVLPGDKVE